MKCEKIAVSVAVVDAIAATVAIAVHCSWVLAIYNVNHYACWICVSFE
jgi:hypothetical protein